MFDKTVTNGRLPQVGIINVYSTDSNNQLLNSIPISKFSKADGYITCGYDLDGQAVVIAGFPTITTYN